jgi:hypothetical protein
VAKVGVRREKMFLCFIDEDGDIAKMKMSRGGKPGTAPEKVAKVGVKKEKGYLYFMDKDGDVSRAKMIRRK